MIKGLAGKTQPISMKKILNLTRNAQVCPITPAGETLQESKSVKANIKDHLLLTNGNINGRFKRIRSFSTYIPRKNPLSGSKEVPF